MRAGNKDQMLILEIISRMQELQVSSLCSARTRAVDWRTQHRTGLIWLQVHHVCVTNYPLPSSLSVAGNRFPAQPLISTQSQLGAQVGKSVQYFRLEAMAVTSSISIVSDSSHTRYSLSSSGPSFRPHHSDIIFRNLMKDVYGSSSLPVESPIHKVCLSCLVLQWVKPRTFPSRTSFRRISLSLYFALILMIFKR